MREKVFERSVSSDGRPIVKVKCVACNGEGFRWRYDYDTDPWVEWRALLSKVKRLLGR